MKDGNIGYIIGMIITSFAGFLALYNDSPWALIGNLIGGLIAILVTEEM